MSLSTRCRSRPSICIHTDIPIKHDVTCPASPDSGVLSPDITSNSPPVLCDNTSVSLIGRYLLLDRMDSVSSQIVYRAVHVDTNDEFICKVVELERYHQVLAPYLRVGSHPHVSQVVEVLLGVSQAYILFESHVEDLHSYVRRKRRLREPEAARLFTQMAEAVQHCHECGVVLRDLKLRKFVFKDQLRTQLKIEGLEDALLLADEDEDQLMEKHGCPAYVSPEILAGGVYSGRAADVWSIGVVLYTMLVGQYPFHDPEPSVLFAKIRRGLHRGTPEGVSGRARCLVRGMLRVNAQDRLDASDMVTHPWLLNTCHIDVGCDDQTVPTSHCHTTRPVSL